ncbi:hypothetical protein BaRGS_00025943, partial [Batillaria attramentaria]
GGRAIRRGRCRILRLRSVPFCACASRRTLCLLVCFTTIDVTGFDVRPAAGGYSKQLLGQKDFLKLTVFGGDPAQAARPSTAPPGYGAMESNGKSSDGWSPASSPYNSKSQIVSVEPSKSHPKGSRTFVYFLAVFAVIGGLLFGYDTGIVSGSMLLLQPHFELNTIWQESIVSATIAAAALFALIAGVTCDAIGRKKTIMIASFVFAVGAVVMGVAPDKEVLLVGRIVVGIGIGFASMTVPVYVAESAPADIRGKLVTLNQLFITIGILVSSVVAGAFSEMKETGWRYMLGLAGVPGAIQFIGFLFLPESPRWLVSKGRDDEAREVLRKIRGHDDVEEELKEVQEAEAKKQTGFVFMQIMKTPHVRKALFCGCGLHYYSATILKMSGFPPSLAIWLVCVPFTVNFLATFIGVFLVERLGRKLLTCISFVGCIIALGVLAIGFQLSATHSPPVNRNMTIFMPNMTEVTDKCTTSYSICEDCILNTDCGYCFDEDVSGYGTCLLAKDGDKEVYSTYGRCGENTTFINTTFGHTWAYGYCPTDYTWMAVLGLALFVLSFAPGLGPMPWTINSEIYPMWARGTGNAIATFFNWAFNLLVSYTFLTLTETITKYGTFWLFAGICVLGLTFTIIFVPETRNKSLEEVEELFMTKEKREQHRREREKQEEITVEYKPEKGDDTRL